MNVFTTLAVAVVILLAAVLGFAATRPDTFRVQRAKSIEAPPDEIFPLIHDFHKWRSWSPYEKLDPTMKRTYSGAANGKGAVYEWVGTSKVGSGRMEIRDASGSKVTIKLDFLKPFECHHTAEFTLEAHGDTTNVTWSMHGAQRYLAKVMSIFLNMDNLIGKDFEAGLANIKAVAEINSNQRSALCN
jgi:Polyketide cyclase / dehydrase and lipid transport